MPLWRGLAATWFRESKKRKRPAKVEVPPPVLPVVHGPKPDERSPEFAGATRDERPAHQGWMPGVHLRRCPACDQKYVGAISATRCADCAYGAEEAA